MLSTNIFIYFMYLDAESLSINVDLFLAFKRKTVMKTSVFKLQN